MTLAHREPIRLGPAPWHWHRGPWVSWTRPGVKVNGRTGDLIRVMVEVRTRLCDCGRITVVHTWPGGRRTWRR